MTQRKRKHGRRSAFTLIELLVVIAIIAILMALLGAAVMHVLVKGPEMQTFSDLNTMTSALASEEKDLNVPVLPSHLRLREDNNYSDPNPAVGRGAELLMTKAFLQQAFGRHITDPGTQIDWNGDGTFTSTGGVKGDLVLEGEQCLVFWLGGVPVQANGVIGMKGFPPQVQGGATGKRGPFFEFKPNRLKMFQALDPYNNGALSLQFPVYLDAWNAGSGRPWGQGMCYAFFASYKTEGIGSYQPADCLSLGLAAAGFNPTTATPGPYQDPTGKWMNAGSCQILSAGAGGVFGTGGQFNPATGLTAPNPGVDDQSNFSGRVLGATSN